MSGDVVRDSQVGKCTEGLEGKIEWRVTNKTFT